METVTSPPLLLRNRPFTFLFAARAISVLGNGFARVALAFAVLGLPGATPTELSVVLACQALPQLLFVLLGGVIADRTSRSGLMIVADVIGLLAYGAMAVVLLTGQATIPVLAALAVVSGISLPLFLPALSGVVPEIVPTERLQQANALLQTAVGLSLVLGFGLSGLVVSLVGAGWAIALNAVSFLVSAVLVWAMRLPPQTRVTATSGWVDLRDGWREFSSRQWLWVVVLQQTVTVAAIVAVTGVLGPLAAEDGLGGAPAWSVIVACHSLGLLAGSTVARRLRPRRPLVTALLLSFVFPIPMVLLGIVAPVWLTALSMFACGVAGSFFGVLWMTTVQREVPAESLSRVSSYDLFGQLTLAPLTLLFIGPLAQSFGYGAVLVWCGVLMLLSSLGALLSPQVRGLRAG
ncbi:MFS transporter [Allokutzneria sp. A3M-2-11 16]|uniref:MFS transporter n=1 Tax=Allokutzneria sp. A3M-2-11 16 TaxID=2962043 RepID=UPI0020B87698|nr:MFS transporter [Allokutzneria sp. A3M-2-11 16]MCP3801422.1 MFS transporter [Allokutzneria sp. A3M-2-11 16]